MPAEERTEKPTPKRRAQARRNGQVPTSVDLNGAMILIAGLVGVSLFAARVLDDTVGAMRAIFAVIATPNEVTSAAGLKGLSTIVRQTVVDAVGPIAALCVAVALLVNVAQVGLHPTLQSLKPKPSRLNPATGVKNIFGKRMPVEAIKSISKVAIVGAVVATALLPALTSLGASVGMAPAALTAAIGSQVMAVAERAAIAYLLLGVIDAVYQRRRVAKSLRMTKQEVKEEARQHSLPPQVKSAIRRRQIQAARARMMAAVPKADVVVTNPTHYAVALVYDGSRPAPEVVAKGQDLVAAQIRRIAEENGVPIVADPPLARALHASVEIGQMVPDTLWEAVAQVLAFVYRAAGRRKATGS